MKPLDGHELNDKIAAEKALILQHFLQTFSHARQTTSAQVRF